ncbi:MAG: DMT family transporter [Clostridia bacterium]|nr:DMT family transporter [Clostridia bacterium]
MQSIQNKQRPLFGSVMLILCAIVWGLAFAFQRKAANSINPIAFNGLRFSLAAVTIFIFLVIYELINKKRGIKSTGWNKSTIFGGICCGIALLIASNLQQYGIQFTSGGKASFITALYIVLVPILGLLTGRKPRLLSCFAIPIAMAGFWLMCSTGGETLGEGDLYGLLSTGMFALQILFIDVFGSDSDPIKITLVQFVTCAVVSIPCMAIAGFPSSPELANPDILISLMYVGIFSAGIGYTLQTIGQKYTEPSVASLIMSLESVIGLIGCVLILQENHSVIEMLGCVLVFVAVILAQLQLKKKFLQFDKKRYIITSSIMSRLVENAERVWQRICGRIRAQKGDKPRK